MPFSSDEINEAEAAIEQMAEAFETLSSICHGLSQTRQQDVFNPETLGPISAFLGLGNGYEAAYKNCQFTSAETLMAILREDDEDEEEEDDEDEEEEDDEEEEEEDDEGES